MPGMHYVACNLESGTIQAVSFLLKKGHRIIGMINGPEKLFASRERLEGYIKAMKKNRLKFDPKLIITSDLTKEGTHKAMRQLLSQKRKPTAIVAFNDYVALDGVEYSKNMKLEINKDITFVSYANLPISNYLAFPPVASVEQYPYQQGQKATETLLEILSKDKEETATFYRTILESELVIHKRELMEDYK
jgi:LacI family transcriptional regulator